MLTLGRSRSPMLVLAGMVGTVMLLMLLAMGGLEEAGLLGASGTAPLARAGLPNTSAARQSVPGMSSRFASTYRLADGTLSTHVSSTPVNFRDAHGRWRAIDSRLVARGDAFANRAGAHAVSLPRRLSQGIHVSAGRDRLSMRLLGADGTVAVRGAQARYRDVLPGVSAIYDSQATGLRERLVLADRTAPARFVFALQASRGLHPRQQANGDVVFSRAGQTAFVLPASFAYAQSNQDETHPVSSVLRRRHGGWTLSVAADRGWVHEALGRGPVVIDPTVEIDPDSQDCFIESDTPTTNYCSDTHLSVGYDGVNDQRGLVQFDLSVLPKDAVILNADFGLTLGYHSTNNLKQVGVYRVLQPWTNSATWNKYDATHSWATAGAAGGADASSSSAAVVTTGTGSGFVDWYPTKLVQDWVNGALPNYGFLIRDVNPNTTAHELDFNQREGGSVTPELDIVWSERTGLSDDYVFDGQALDGKTDIAVNVANGNLFVDTRGLSVPGNGLDLELQNYHNSLASPTDLQGEGIRGTASLGGDVHLKVFDPTTVAFFRGDGLNASFLSPTVSGTTATYITPPEFGNATMTRDTSTNVYTLNLPDGAPAWPDADLTMTFASSGKLTSVKDAAGHAISLSYFSGGGQELPALSGITDTNGANFTLDPNPAGDSYISDVADPAGHHWSYVYGHDNTDYLTTYTAGDTGQTWHYDYDSSHRLTSVTTPDGKVTKITYVGTTSKTASIMVTTDAAHTTGPTTTYAYSGPSAPCDPANGDIGKTVVTPPGGPAVTYCHDAQDQITYDDRVTGDADASCDTSTPVDDGEGPVDCSAPEPDLSVWPSLDPDAPQDPAPQGLAAAAATPPVPTRFAWAFSDQNPEFLQQPGTPPSVVARMIPRSPNDLPIVRLTVPYNVVSDAPVTDPGDPGPGGGPVHKAHLRYVRLQRVKAWIVAAYAAHKRVLISFEHCATVTPGANAAAQSQPDNQDAAWCADPAHRPTTRAYHDAVRAFLIYNPAAGPDFRQIEFFTAWNEPNHKNTQPTGGTDRRHVDVTHSGAFQAGEYFYTLDHMCRASYGCTVGAGDFFDRDLPHALNSEYFKEYKKGMRRNPPAFWAWHAYNDTLLAITKPTSAHWSTLKEFLRATQIRSRTPARQPPVMITEVGVTYADSTGRTDEVANDDGRADLGMQRLMTEAPVAHTSDPRTRGRIKSLFYYALRGALGPNGTQTGFDSGLLSPANNHVRPMWQTWCNTVIGETCDTSLVGQDAGPRDQNLYP